MTQNIHEQTKSSHLFSLISIVIHHRLKDLLLGMVSFVDVINNFPVLFIVLKSILSYIAETASLRASIFKIDIIVLILNLSGVPFSKVMFRRRSICMYLCHLLGHNWDSTARNDIPFNSKITDTWITWSELIGCCSAFILISCVKIISYLLQSQESLFKKNSIVWLDSFSNCLVDLKWFSPSYMIS